MNTYKVFFDHDGKKKCKTVSADCPLDASDDIVAEYLYANVHEVRLIKEGVTGIHNLLNQMPQELRDLFDKF